MKARFLAPLLLALAAPAAAQSFGGPATIQQPTTPNDCVKVVSANVLADSGHPCPSGGTTVSSVTNSDGSLTFSPTTGAVVGSINAAHGNTFTAAQIINLNAAAAPTPVSGTVLQVVGADGAGGFVENDTFGAAPIFTGRRADGTGALPTAVQNGDTLAGFSARPYDGSAYASASTGNVQAVALENFTTAHHGTGINFNCTAITTLTTAQCGSISATGLNLPTGETYQINGSQIASANLSDSANIALLNAANTFTNNQVVSQHSFGLSGNQSASGIFGTAGIRYKNVAGTLTDTTSSGTIATNYDSVFGGNTLTATNATTITNNYGTYFLAPVCSTNVTCTANYALGADSAAIGTAQGFTVSTAGLVTAGNLNVTSSAVPTNGMYLSNTNTVSLATGGSSRFTLNSVGLTLVGQLTVGASGVMQFNGRTQLYSGSDGILTVANFANTGFTRLELGGTTSSFPAIKVNGAAINFRLADDSANTSITASTAVLSAVASNTGAQSGYLCYNSGTGVITYDGTNTCLVSLDKYKNNLGPITGAVALSDVLRLKPFWGTYKAGTPMNDHYEQPFLSAEQAQSVDKRLAAYNSDGKLQGVRYANSVAVIIAAMQEQQTQIASLRAENARLRAANDNARAREASFEERLSALEHPRRKMAAR